MKDGKISGTGNSWALKSVPNARLLYPTHEKLLDALESGSFFVDLLRNPPGWEEAGDLLGEETLLKAATAALFGMGEDAVPDEIFEAIRPLISAAQGSADAAIKSANLRTRMTCGSYVGTGTSKQLVFSFEPRLLIVCSVNTVNNIRYATLTVAIRSMRYSVSFTAGGSTSLGETYSVSLSENYATFEGMNVIGRTYTYAAIG